MNRTDYVHIVECPRDAMQGWPTLLSTDEKIHYLNTLLRVGFQTLDFGSFVSPKAIPQMADTREVVKALDTSSTATKLLAIIANVRGAEEAATYGKVSTLGFPFSVSETFQQRNTNSSREESFERVRQIQKICSGSGKELVVYLSMGFGNPYGDPYTPQLVSDWGRRIADLGVTTISLADTVGLATAEQVKSVTSEMIAALPHCTIGVHLHAPRGDWEGKVRGALDAGCRRIDGALRGIGGCPMAGNELVGNLPTEELIPFLRNEGLLAPLDTTALAQSLAIAQRIFH